MHDRFHWGAAFIALVASGFSGAFVHRADLTGDSNYVLLYLLTAFVVWTASAFVTLRFVWERPLSLMECALSAFGGAMVTMGLSVVALAATTLIGEAPLVLMWIYGIYTVFLLWIMLFMVYWTHRSANA